MSNNWIASVLNKQLENYHKLDLRMQRLIRWSIRLFILILCAVALWIFSNAYNKFKEPKIVYKIHTIYKTLPPIHDTITVTVYKDKNVDQHGTNNHQHIKF